MDNRICIECSAEYTPLPRGGTHQVTCSQPCRDERRRRSLVASTKAYRERRRRAARAAEMRT